MGRDTPDFAVTLRSIMRQTPDVILVGEMRDAETMATALTAAETGHLVLSTLHTNDADPGGEPHSRFVPRRATSRRSASSSRWLWRR